MGAAVTEIDKSDPKTYWEISDRTALSFSLDDTPGILLKALSVFTNNQINLTRIQSKPYKIIDHTRLIEFYVDVDGSLHDSKISSAITELESIARKVTIVGTPEVPWFPT